MSLLNKVTLILIGIAIVAIILVLIRNKVVPAKDEEGVDPRPQANKPFIDWMKSYSRSEKGYAFFNLIFKNNVDVNIPGLIVCQKGIFVISTPIKTDIIKIKDRRNDVIFYENKKQKIKKSYDFIKDSSFMIKQVRLITKQQNVQTILPTRGQEIVFNEKTRSMNMYDIKTYIDSLPNIIDSEEVEKCAQAIEHNNKFDMTSNKRKFGSMIPKLW